MKQYDMNTEINEFLETWDSEQMIAFLRDIIPLFVLFDVDDESDWVKEAVGEEDTVNVRLVRAFYLVSKIAENHAGRLASIKAKHKNLWKRMEKSVEGISNDRDIIVKEIMG